MICSLGNNRTYVNPCLQVLWHRHHTGKGRRDYASRKPDSAPNFSLKATHLPSQRRFVAEISHQTEVSQSKEEEGFSLVQVGFN